MFRVFFCILFCSVLRKCHFCHGHNAVCASCSGALLGVCHPRFHFVAVTAFVDKSFVIAGSFEEHGAASQGMSTQTPRLSTFFFWASASEVEVAVCPCSDGMVRQVDHCMVMTSHGAPKTCVLRIRRLSFADYALLLGSADLGLSLALTARGFQQTCFCSEMVGSQLYMGSSYSWCAAGTQGSRRQPSSPRVTTAS